MRSKSITIGSIAGVPLKIQFNWFITAVMVTWSLSAGYLPLMFPGYTTSTYWIYGGISSILFFTSVLVHEFGHAVVSMKEGVRVRSISLFIFGGMAHISREPSTPRSEFRIVAAGPLASLVLGTLFTIVSILWTANPLASGAAQYLGQLNFILALFNLIPAFPLDGGRLLRSALWALKKDFHQATRWAVTIGMALSGVSILIGFYLFARGFFFNGAWILFIGIYLAYTARMSYLQSIKYAPWPNTTRKITPAQLESISLRGWPKSYRTAIVRVEAVNHYPIFLPVEKQPETIGTMRDSP